MAHSIDFGQNIEFQINRQCWICSENQNNKNRTDWIIACKCITNKWIHRNCLEDFVDSKQNGNTVTKVFCPHCGFKYIILYPNFGLMIKIFDLVDEIINVISPFVAGGFLVSTIYIGAVVHGGITYMQIFGWKNGFYKLWTNKALSIIFLPIIPTCLVLSRFINWQDVIINKLTFSKNIAKENSARQGKRLAILMRTVYGALFAPIMGQIFGEVFFSAVGSKFKRIIYGGLVYLGVKGVLKIYHRQSTINRQLYRQIKDYDHSI